MSEDTKVALVIIGGVILIPLWVVYLILLISWAVDKT